MKKNIYSLLVLVTCKVYLIFEHVGYQVLYWLTACFEIFKGTFIQEACCVSAIAPQQIALPDMPDATLISLHWIQTMID